MTDRDRASASIQRRRRNPHPRKRTPLPKQPESQEPATEKEQGFLFDPYWDEVFAAYYDPTLHVCCQLRY